MSTLKRLLPMLQPWIFFSRRNIGPSSSIFCPTGIMPITVAVPPGLRRSEEHTSELQSLTNLVCRLLLEKKNDNAFALTPKHTQVVYSRIRRHLTTTPARPL